VQDVNAKGGIYVKEYDKRIPIKFIQYDDKSDIETMIKLVKKLVTEDKVDFLFPPHSSAMHAAAIPLINDFKIPFPVFSAIVSQDDLKDMGKYPYRFVIFPDMFKMNGPFINLAKEMGVKTMAIVYVQDQMGIVYNSSMEQQLKEAGISMVLNKSYPLGATDVSTLLKEIKTLNPDALVAFTYPGDSILLTEQSKVIGLNPKFFFVGIGGGMPMYRDKFGAKTVEGVLSWGGWSPSINAHTQAYWDGYKALNKFTPDYYSGHWAYAYAEVMEQAIEKAGSLDREKVRQVLMTETFKGTVMAVDVKFTNYMNPNLYSYVGQWQNGVLESVMPKETRKVKVIYPKADWQ
jgi:branched-chain amino acid transport system substrate-binding protein